MSYLTATVHALLNAFSQSQPALNEPGTPRTLTSGVQLGDLIEGAADLAAPYATAAAASATAASGSAAAALVSKNAASASAAAALVSQNAAAVSAASLERGQSTADGVTGHVVVAGMTATGAALAFDVTTGAPYAVTVGAGFIVVTPGSVVNWLVIKLS